MREQMRKRLEELQSELTAGSQRLQELEREQAQLHEVMLRISGAKQVLQELLAGDADGAATVPTDGNGAGEHLGTGTPQGQTIDT
jgi:prefoldin subunit 5